MNIKSLSVFSVIVIILSILTLSISTMKSRELQRELAQLEDNRFNSMLLAQELFQSSEDLTRMARAYIVTADPVHKNNFFRILGIRNGELPRPTEYSPAYWYIETTGEEHTIAPETIALKTLILRRNLALGEIALLNESQKRSDKLTKIEKQAFAFIDDLSGDSYEKQAMPDLLNTKLARDLLWGDEYIEAKAQIMLPLNKFMSQLNERTQIEFSVAQQRLNQITLIKMGALVMLLLSSVMFAGYVRLRMLLPLEGLVQQAKAIASGKYSVRCKTSGANEIDELGESFNIMAEAVQRAIEGHKKAEDLLWRRQMRLNEAQHMTQVGNWELDLVNGELYWSDEIFNIFEINKSKFGASYESFLSLIHPEDKDMVSQAYTTSVETGKAYEITHRLLMPSGSIKYVEERCKTIYDDQGKPISSKGTIQDVTQRQQSEETIRLYASVFELSGEAMLIMDGSHKIIATNAAFHKLTGYEQQEILNQDFDRLRPAKETLDEYQTFWTTLDKNDFWQGEITSFGRDGYTYIAWLAITAIRSQQKRIINYIASYKNITEHKAAMDKIHYLAHHDSLTDLPNRFSLVEQLNLAIKSAERDKEKVAVMFIDLDRFKIINDTLGHHIGDLLLISVAKRLKSCVRGNDTVARLGGDEFVVLLRGIESKDITFHIADQILQTLGQSYSLKVHLVHSSPSIGIAFYPDDGNDADEVMKNADVAMYSAKSNGRNNYQFFESSMNQAISERVELEHDLQSAIKRDEFVLHYQPKIDAKTLRVVGVEALIRWQHPKKGLIYPSVFIFMAEESGLMLSLGEWVLHTACRQLGKWQEQGMSDLQMSVNLSASQFCQKNLSVMVESILTEENVNPALLEIEITESMAMDNPQESIQSMKRLRQIGVKLAVDDFGTGYSSLSYLKQFPVNCLKLDRSYVKDIETDPNDAVICSATISLAHNLGLKVVAEGVETDKQYEYLKRLNCNMIQGYYFCKPLPANEAKAYISSCNLKKLSNTESVSSINILVIDDDSWTCDFHAQVLENLGHKPTPIEDPIEGLEIYRERSDQFELVMLDMLMPKMSGVDLIKSIRGINPNVPIMVITGYKPDATRETLRSIEKDSNLIYGINFFIIEKPLTPESINEYINKIL